ncbi:MAG: ribbon-helix-helix protein, CopG family [Candidatus Binatia bacterium]
MTSCRYRCTMGSTKRATLYLDADLHRAVRVKAAETERSVSELLNEALRQSLAEDAEDLEASRSRAKEPSLDFERVLKDLRRRGKL